MQYGLAFPYIDVHVLLELAQEAEAAGWDGVFYWDGGGVEPWVALTAMAMHTERVRLGTMVTPLPRQQPWKVASAAATLDHLSKGRVILPVGLGVIELEKMGIVKDYKVRAQMLDEGLEIVDQWWRGEPFSYDGTYYQIEETSGMAPVQTPRIPIWVHGGERQSQILRAARWDGVKMGGTPAQVQQGIQAIMAHRTAAAPLDIITESETPGDDPEQAAEIVRPYAQVGVTWWIEAIWDSAQRIGGVEGMRARIKQGPPRI
ncbi:LLM class flavin-dependent oxidoreductase [Dictyobacter kobayashii]|uniref:Luciferase-like protein n=1 Tax=Dictyobacter kobayashii TaxID=2014872 RepID=A0A402ALY2_9CHLR|nr:LLM class flavin-dependent oxidoreductase [Dictyobacter kobayashii]GCE20147.1 luciferase-like protein [Dictyobacter kobayashii]